MINYRGESRDIGLVSKEGSRPVKNGKYCESGEGISRPAKTTIIKERNGKREKQEER